MTSALPPGTVFSKRYRILRCIASGGMGAVYEALHIETERHKALKVMHPHIFQDNEMRERFKQEAKIAARVESEHIVDVSDAGIDEDTQTPFLVMELLRGEDLSHRLKRVGRLAPGEVLTYLHQTALALDKTHASSIVHRDLKPENIFLTQREDGSVRVKILDFGVAKVVAEGSKGGATTQVLGTPTYMAPEQFRLTTKLTPAADIYALGMIAYTLLVGKAYWANELRIAGNLMAFLLEAVNGPQEAATARAGAMGVTLPPAFDAWFAKATALSPTTRFNKASEAVRALDEVLRAPSSHAAQTSQAGVTAAAPSPITQPLQTPSSLPGVTPQARLPLTSAPAAVSAAPPSTTTTMSGSTEAGSSLTVAKPSSSARPLMIIAGLGLAIASTAGGLWLIFKQGNKAPVAVSSTNDVAPSKVEVPPAAPTPTYSAPSEPSVAPAGTPSSTGAGTPPPSSTGSATLRPPAPVVAPSPPTQPRAPAAKPSPKPAPLFGRD